MPSTFFDGYISDLIGLSACKDLITAAQAQALGARTGP
jgi:hypothetical protein